MEPITREEYYLAKIAGTYKGKTPEPVTIDEYYLATMAGDYSGNTPQPVTRLQYYMAKVAGVWGGSIPAPVTRLEYYWAAIASGEGKVFPPVTREEHFLVLVADAYSVVLTVVTGNSALLENSKGNRGLESLTLYGKSTQGSTTGAQLFDANIYESEFNFGDKVTVKRQNGVFIFHGVSERYYCNWKSVPTPQAGTYCANCNTSGTEPSFRIYFERGTDKIYIGNDKPFIIDGTETSFMYGIGTQAAMNTEGKTLTPFLCRGDKLLPYEPYTGGAPSPSPEYPQEIESAGQDGEIGVDVYGGNLIDASTVIMGKVIDNKTGDELLNERYACSGFIPIYSDVILSQTNGEINQRAFYDADKKFINASINVNPIKAPSNARYIRITSTIDKQDMEDVMLNIGSTALPYEPYKPAQTLIIPTPNGLPGIPVSSGGNYTDKDGQQWVCDEVDFKKGVYVQRVAKEIPKTSFTVIETFDTKGRYRFDGVFKNVYKNGINESLISHGIYFAYGNKINTWAIGSRSFYYSPAERTTVDKIKEKILSLINSDNPLTFLGQLETPIEIPLTTEQLAKYKALRTYSPTTTVINDAGAGMSAGYAKMK